jgi:hypothetical protein
MPGNHYRAVERTGRKDKHPLLPRPTFDPKKLQNETRATHWLRPWAVNSSHGLYGLFEEVGEPSEPKGLMVLLEFLS